VTSELDRVSRVHLALFSATGAVDRTVARATQRREVALFRAADLIR